MSSESSRRDFLTTGLLVPAAALASTSILAPAEEKSAQSSSDPTTSLESKLLKVEINETTGRWALVDKRSGARWPSRGMASAGEASWLEGSFKKAQASQPDSVKLVKDDKAIAFTLVDGGAGLELRYEDKPRSAAPAPTASGLGLDVNYEEKPADTIRALREALAITDVEGGGIIVPCREGLLVSADSGKVFKNIFGTSDYEPGSHMNMFGFLKAGSALIVTWDDAYTFPEVQSLMPPDGPYKQLVTATFELRRTARSVRLTPLGKGDWNVVAAAYRRMAEKKGTAVTLREKMRRDPKIERMLGASNAKLWQCLARRLNEESTAVERVRVNWTFDEAAQVAEHLSKDLKMDRCFFTIGGWTEGGYDVRHPDNLPANPECGGDKALADAIKRIQALDYIACLHDNVQDMYKDAKSWSPDYIEKKPDGSLIPGGRWMGGRAWMVCAPKQLELAQRPQNLTAIHKLFDPWAYFIDTTYAVGPRECFDPKHPIGRNDDIAWKIKLSDYARQIFGIFGSECGREWALTHSDFFEGLVGVGGRYFHRLNPDEYGATPIPFWEMVYHDCQALWGKYGYAADKAAEYVGHHVLCARPLHYHSIPNHIYWKSADTPAPKVDQAQLQGVGCYVRADKGWAEGMHMYDVFMKNTHEILGPLQYTTAHDVLTRLDFLTADRTLRQATYGQARGATRITVNFGAKEAKVSTAMGREVVLPQWGFVVEGPRFAAFYALAWGGLRYDNGALFTLRPADQRDLRDSREIRVFHGFGNPSVNWNGKTHEVPREQVIRV